MDLDDLRGVQSSERSTDSLQPLSDSFYRDVVDYIEGLREERARAAERAEDPFGSEEVRRLTDEIETAEEVAEAIYDRRIGKVVKRASLAAAGMPADEEGLTDEEARLFADLVDQIESHRGTVLSAFAGEESIETVGSADADEQSARTVEDTPQSAEPTATVADSAPAADRVDPEPAPDQGTSAEVTGDRFDASEAMGGEGEPPVGDGSPGTGTDSGSDPGNSGTGDPEPAASERSESTDSGEIGRTTVRITRDVGEIMGVDEHVYELAAEDVVRLPEANAAPLIERDAASRID